MELFYAFKDFKSIKQDRSKLCWAACIEMILTSIDTHHLEDEFQINAAKKYKSIFNISNILPVNDDNVEIREDHLKTMFNHYNIKLNEFHCNVYNFDFYKNTLNETKMPILMGITGGIGLGNVGHLVLVCGYGYCNSNKYLLIYDSDKPYDKPFVKISENHFYDRLGNQPIRVWSTQAMNISDNIRNQLYRIEYPLLIKKTNTLKISNSNIKLEIPYFDLYTFKLKTEDYMNPNIPIKLLNVELEDDIECLDIIQYRQLESQIFEIESSVLSNVTSYESIKFVSFPPYDKGFLDFGLEIYPINFSDNFTFEARKYKKSEFSSILESRKSRETSIIFNH